MRRGQFRPDNKGERRSGIITGPHYGPVLFCLLTSVVVFRLSLYVTLPAVGRPTLHGGPVVLRPIRATPGYARKCSECIVLPLVRK